MTDANDQIASGVTVITGAGRGLGRALAIELTRRGQRVVGLGRDSASLDETAQHISSDLFSTMVADVADSDVVQAAFDRVRADIGPVTILINNAAVYPRRDILDETPESFMQTVSINLGGQLSCTHAALRGMTETGVGRIVNVASMADIAPISASAAYSVSKGAGRTLTRALVADLGDRFPDIVISDWLPGALKTSMGIPDGLEPEVAAVWGANLALWHDPSLNGAVFERDQELLPPRSLKRRVLGKLLLQAAPQPRRLSG